MNARFRRSAAIAVTAALLAPAAAQAAGELTRSASAGVVTYTYAATTPANTLAVSATRGLAPSPTTVRFASPQPITEAEPIAQCSAVSGGRECVEPSSVEVEIAANGAAGSDIFSFDDGDRRCIFCRSLPTTFDGGGGADTLSGSIADDDIDGGSGGDVIRGEFGNDDISGGTGNDTIDGADGEDRLNGGNGDDTLTGGDGEDDVSGDDDDDTITAGPENDRVNGGAGAGDHIRYDEPNRGTAVRVDLGDFGSSDGGPGELTEDAVAFEHVTGTGLADVLTGDAEANVLEGSGGGDDLTGGGGEDTLSGSGGADRLTGGDGGDTLHGGAQADVLDGGPGPDLIDGAGDADTADYSARSDALAITVGAGGDDDGGAFDGPAGARDDVRDVEVILGGSAGDALLSAEAGGVRLEGNGGDDALTGTSADDTLVGGAGADTIDGAAGIDTTSYAEAERDSGVTVTLGTGTGDDGASPFDQNAGGARDTVSGVEAVLGSRFADVLVGDTLANRLLGGAADDVLQGRGGGDVLRGGDGSDTTSYAERDATTAVTVTLDGAPGDGAPGEGDDVGADVESVLGGAGADVLTGNDGVNGLTGLDGNDRLVGLGGVDAFVAGAGDDDVRALDGNPELVDCGDGAGDRVEVDESDETVGCEQTAIAKPLVDADGDGSPEGKDCDDRDAARTPGAIEVPGNAVDEDCVDGPAPFPDISVNITHLITRTGSRTRFTRFTVTGIPRGGRVRLTCKAPKRANRRRACPFRRFKRTFADGRAKLSLLRLFEKRRLKPGVVVELRVRAPQTIGTVRRLRMRKGKDPRQRTLCLVPGERRPSRCPKAG